jgi:hypothetical protein
LEGQTNNLLFNITITLMFIEVYNCF